MEIAFRHTNRILNRIPPEEFATAPRGLVVVHSAIDRHPTDLNANELALAGDVSPLRYRQLATGRNLCRIAIGIVGGNSDVDILADPRGLPIWPSGILGSISHTSSHCAVVVCAQGTVSAVGIDLETNESNFKPAEWRLVSNRSEREFASEHRNLSRGQYVNLIFSAKEAVYKCLSPIIDSELAFEDVECRPRGDKRGFSVEIRASSHVSQVTENIQVDWLALGENILTLAWIA